MGRRSAPSWPGSKPQIDGETVPDVTEYAVTGNEKPPPFAVVAADGGFLERNRKKGYLLLR